MSNSNNAIFIDGLWKSIKEEVEMMELDTIEDFKDDSFSQESLTNRVLYEFDIDQKFISDTLQSSLDYHSQFYRKSPIVIWPEYVHSVLDSDIFTKEFKEFFFSQMQSEIKSKSLLRCCQSSKLESQKNVLINYLFNKRQSTHKYHNTTASGFLVVPRKNVALYYF